MTYDRERKEADAIQSLSRQRMAAAEQLQAAWRLEADPAARPSWSAASPPWSGCWSRWPRHRAGEEDAKDAGEFLRSLEETYEQAGQKLKSARSELERAQRDMGRAAQQRDVARARAEAARQAAGLSQATSGLSVALKAMQDNAARDLAQAESANAKAKLLAPTRPEKDDPHIAAAMNLVKGGAPSGSLSDRLGALRKRSGEPARLQGPSPV
jgi:DNA repair exonuclease SbcCD ATPase subunit